MGEAPGAHRLQVADDLDAMFAEVYSRGWTDGLPVIPPTPERVERMLRAVVRQSPSTVVGTVPPKQGAATLEAIAINGVMAGCLPEYMPALVASVRAMCRPEFNLAAIQGTSDPTTPAPIVNGPIRARIDINCGENAAGPGRRANATIGRAIRLIMLNIGGGEPGRGDKSILGQPAKYTFCLGENEEESPWEPFHVERGFKPTTSAVTMVPVLYTEFVSPCVKDPSEALRAIAGGMAVPGHANVGYAGTPVTIIMPVGLARMLAKQGFSKQKVKEVLYEHARIPLSRQPRGEKIWPYEHFVVDDEIRVVKEPEDILVFVAGGHGYSVLYLGGWYYVEPTTEEIIEATGANASKEERIWRS